mgnify:CR=1 FL=1
MEIHDESGVAVAEVSPVIYKYSASDKIPASSRIIHFDQQGPHMYIWAEYYGDCDESLDYKVLGTGQPIPAGYEHFMSAQNPPFVWHLYLKK